MQGATGDVGEQVSLAIALLYENKFTIADVGNSFRVIEVCTLGTTTRS
ncbi:hypothetical protein PN450_19665 [Dolichospermum lemmermannii CS-548]|nr:hypothetical protein [Dolichospermum lemmermannii]MDB9438962.1 hypothetical protein [Dolichospermum lemmermannii CS-548]